VNPRVFAREARKMVVLELFYSSYPCAGDECHHYLQKNKRTKSHKAVYFLFFSFVPK
jgi:hypothetical protein